MKEYDVTVVGGGPAGYVAAIKAAQLGAKVCLVESEQLGGTCLNHGCIPTKTLLHLVDFLRELQGIEKCGIHLVDQNWSIDLPAMKRHKDGIVRKLVSGVASLLKSHQVEVFSGQARIAPDLSVTVDDRTIVAAGKVIFAGGSLPVRPNIPGAESSRVLTSQELLALDTLPEKLVVIGGGVIGVEMTRIFSALKTEVTIVELADRLIPSFDEEISDAVRAHLEHSGVRIHLAAKVERIDESPNGISVLLVDGETIPGTHVLLAVGRKANLSGVGDLNLEMRNGFIQVDRHMESCVPGLYAPGDANGQCMLAHAAYRMAEIAAEDALGGKKEFSPEHVPQVLYGYPEAASVGMTESLAGQSGRSVIIGRFPFAANGRALSAGQAEGFVKLIADAEFGEVLGVQMMGPQVSELINEATALMTCESTLEEILESVHAHPTFSEAFAEAAGDALNKAVHLPAKTQKSTRDS